MRIVNTKLPFLWLSLAPILVTPKSGVYTIPLQTHDDISPHRRRRLTTTTDTTERISSVYQGKGTHYVDLWVGSPTPQRQTVIVDTGSVTTAFPCEGCTDCGEKNHVDHYFDFDASESFQKTTCGAEDYCRIGRCLGGSCYVDAAYVERSSWSAFEARDVLYPGGPHEGAVTAPTDDRTVDPVLHASEFAFNMSFGCESGVSGMFRDQLADGIMGMGIDDRSMWKQMYDEGRIDKQLFSLCLLHKGEAKRSGTPAGAMTLGGFDERLWKTPVVYAGLATPAPDAGEGFQTAYNVKLRGLYLSSAVDGTVTSVGTMTEEHSKNVEKIDVPSEKLNSPGVIVDSGTTSTYFNTQIEAPFEKVWNEMVGAKHSNVELDMTDEQLKKVPTILIQLQAMDQNGDLDAAQTPGLAGLLDEDNKHDVIIAVPPERYIMYMTDRKKFKSTFYFKDTMGTNIIGANVMAGHDVVFDIDNQRVGFAESDCSLDIISSERLVDSHDI